LKAKINVGPKKAERGLNMNNTTSIGKKKTPQINLNELDLPENLTEVSLKTLVDGIVAPRLEEIFKLIFEEIEKSGFGQQIPSGLVISGGGALTIGMLETGKRVVGLPIRIGFPEKISGLVDEILDPQYSTTVGLLLYGMKNDFEDRDSLKNFGKILKDFKLGNSLGNLKNFFKQFIP